MSRQRATPFPRNVASHHNPPGARPPHVALLFRPVRHNCFCCLAVDTHTDPGTGPITHRPSAPPVQPRDAPGNPLDALDALGVQFLARRHHLQLLDQRVHVVPNVPIRLTRNPILADELLQVLGALETGTRTLDLFGCRQ